jgi:hypothetical protein
MLADQRFEIVRERGPLPEKRLLELVGDFDAFLCGDDAITRAVLEKSLPRLKVVTKYGIGLDKVDVAAATALKIPVTFCPGELEAKAAKQTDIHDGLLSHAPKSKALPTSDPNLANQLASQRISVLSRFKLSCHSRFAIPPLANYDQISLDEGMKDSDHGGVHRLRLQLHYHHVA